MEKYDANRKVQQLSVSLLKKFIAICEEHNLRYFFTGGSLIGVLRHEGFIPWDDDIDLGMPRKDYEKLLQILEQEMPEGYGICNRYTNKNWHFNMSQFFDKESEITIYLAEQPRKAYVWLDVFPLDGLPMRKCWRWIWVKYILAHRYLVQIANISTQVDAHRSRPLKERIVLGICKAVPIGKVLNTDKILGHMEYVLKKYDFDDAEYAGNMLGRYREREVVPKKYFGTPVKAVFEGIEVNIPEMSHELQTALYGDYMKMPPECDRVAHNVTIHTCRKI